MRIGIMQGRLSPPAGGKIQSFPADWQGEFPKAQEAGIDFIEWIWEEDGNPLFQHTGAVRSLVSETNIAVESVCADRFMHAVVVSHSMLSRVFAACAHVGVKRVVLPFVDGSSARDFDPLLLAAIIQHACKCAAPEGSEIHVESDLPPSALKELCGTCPQMKVCYDTGNSAALGYDVSKEFAAYGDRIGSIHIKDRVFGGSTVPLGTGSVEWSALSTCLQNLDYRGPFTLQAARGESGAEVALARSNRQFAEMLIRKVACP
jgi:hexulose-6-phosphate isomerase